MKGTTTMATKPATSVIEAAEEIIDGAVDAVVEEGIEFSAGATDVVAVIQGLNTPGAAFYSSIKSDSFANKKALAKALTASTPVDESMGEIIKLTNFVVLPVDLANDSGEVTTAPRVILIDADNKAYHGTSVGLLSAIRNLIATLGEPETWEEPVEIKVVQQKGRNGFKFFTINLI